MALGRDIKVGLFVLLGLVLAGLVIFLVGDERKAFSRSVELHAKYSDVQGLKPGAPVTMGGVRIGQVAEVEYSDDPADPTVYVSLKVVRASLGRIRTDSVAQIANKGFLGDKMVVISKGEKGAPLKEDDLVTSTEPKDLFQSADQIVGSADATMKDVRELAAALKDERLQRDLRETVHGLNVLVGQVTEGEGYPNRFLTDKNEAERISRAVEDLSSSATELNATLREVRLAVRQVRTGPGFAHDVLYGPGPSREIAQLGDAANEFATTLRDVRQGNGLARDLLFGGEETNTRRTAENLEVLTTDLRDIVAGIKDGKGTLGALLVDPSVYDDLKRVLGNVERNAVLRALVRYSIRQDEEQPEVQVGSVGENQKKSGE